MITYPYEHLLVSLVETLGHRSIVTDADQVRAYSSDRAGEHGVGTPLAVVFASSTEDVQSVVRLAAVAAVPIVARGAGSGLSGGSAAVDGCIVLSLERMREINVDPQCAWQSRSLVH